MKTVVSNRFGTLFLVLLVTAVLSIGCAPAGEQTEDAPESDAAETGAISVSLKTELDASAADVWKIVGDFGAIDFLTLVLEVSVEGEGIGAVRTITLPEEGKVVERLDALDAEAMTITYSILESTLPIDNYVATMTVTESGESKATFIWFSTFTAKGVPDEEAKKLIEDLYTGGFEDLKKALAGE